MDDELDNAIRQARECGRYFITVSRLEGGTLQHYNISENFPVLDIKASFQAHADDRKKEIEREVNNAAIFIKDPPRRDS